ncbi:MAG: hypothetical protein IPK32_12510 [Verrucomicrobiaceae bacterium]|nr:hypothetical protein [Verrucomicrobiaceae bacterium]
MKNILIPLVCLLIGLGAGYGLRTNQAESATAETVAKKTESSTERAKVGASASSMAAPRRSVAQLGDWVSDFLEDYDSRAAQKEAANMSEEELKSALSLLVTKPRSSTRDSLRAILYQAWAQKDMQAAWKAALADPLDTRGTLTGAVAGVLAKTNPKAALELVQTMGIGGRRSGAQSAVMSAWSKKDVVEAIEYALQHPEILGYYSSTSFSFATDLSKLAQKEPVRAAALAMRFADGSRRTSLLGPLMDGWIERDAKAAFDWALEQTNPKLRQEAVAAAVGAWSKTDPKAALEYVQSIPDNDVRQQSFKAAWSDWFKYDPLAAADHLNGIKDEKMLEEVRFDFSFNTDGYTAEERGQVLAKLPEGTFKTKVMDTMSDSLIRKGNYAAAIDLLEVLPDSTGRDRSVSKLSAEWAKNDPAAVKEWLSKLPDSTDRDLGIVGYARMLARSDPSAAIAEVNAIPDTTLRSSALSNIAVVWLRTDEAAARAWMSTQKGISSTDLRMIEMMAKLGGGSSMLDHLSMPLRVGQRR